MSNLGSGARKLRRKSIFKTLGEPEVVLSLVNTHRPVIDRYSYIPEGRFLPRKEGFFRGRKIFVRKEAFK